MSNKTFASGLLGIGLSLALLSFFRGSAGQSIVDRLLEAAGFGLGGLAGAMLLSWLFWGIIRLIRGASGSSKPKPFLLKSSAILCAIYIVSRMSGLLPN